MWGVLALAVWVQNPEATPEGRTRYLGREVAQTMHWLGADWLMRETREDEENGAALQRWLGVTPRQTVCDLGCGNGYHTLPLARAVGAEGRVLAVDLQPQMLALLSVRAAELGLANIELVEATVDDPRLPPESCDLVLMVDVYHELSHPVRVMRRVRDALKPNGCAVVVEFRAEDPAVPIKPEHTMSKAQVVREMASHGFAWADELGVDGKSRLPWQHALSFARCEPTPRHEAHELLGALVRTQAQGDAREVAAFLARDVKLGTLPKGGKCELRAGSAGALWARVENDVGDVAELELAADGESRWFVTRAGREPYEPRAHGSKRRFFAMNTGMRGTPEEQAALLAELGFDGVGWDLGDLRRARTAMEARGLDVLSAYAVLDVVAENPDPKLAAESRNARLAPLREAMEALRGGPGMLWLAVRHGSAALRSTSGDAEALRDLRALAEHARRTGIEVALYPHHDFWMETADDALRLCRALNDRRVGVCFNLCHFLRTSEETSVRAALESLRSHLLAATVNGADSDGSDWSTLIRPLDSGSYPLSDFLAVLDRLDFRGPVGLQAFGLSTESREHLTRSLGAWRKAHAR
jgi:sugar phosphate isomerase/epimerase/SAM-dependent methyltransferase